MSRGVREHIGGMLQEVDTPAAAYNDDGWAVGQASERLSRQKAVEKFLFVLSDGIPEESNKHPKSRYDLETIVSSISKETDQKLIGLGIGKGTDHVGYYYPNSVANIGVSEMSEKLADVIREAIANYDTF
jgi:cobalamin biosynthesis protein CobT